MIRRAVTLLMCMLGGLPAAWSADGPLVTVTRLDGVQVTGELSSASPDIVLQTADGERVFGWSDLLELQVEAGGGDVTASRPAPTEGMLWFELADGSRFAGVITASTEAGCEVTLRGGQACQVVADALVAIRRQPATESDAPARDAAATEDVAEIRRKDDTLTLRGEVRSLTPAYAEFSWQSKALKLPWARVEALTFARPTPRGASQVVMLRDGSAFAGRVTAGDASTITLESSAFAGLTLSWPEIASVRSRSERLALLSSAPPTQYDFEPLLEKRWEIGRDEDLDGNPIRLNGQVYGRGLVLHSKSELAYRIGGQFAQFAATVGVLDAYAAQGDAVVRVLGDGRELWSERVRGGAAPVSLLVDVRNVMMLTLVVDYGENLDLGDHVAFAMARLIR